MIPDIQRGRRAIKTAVTLEGKELLGNNQVLSVGGGPTPIGGEGWGQKKRGGCPGWGVASLGKKANLGPTKSSVRLEGAEEVAILPEGSIRLIKQDQTLKHHLDPRRKDGRE